MTRKQWDKQARDYQEAWHDFAQQIIDAIRKQHEIKLGDLKSPAFTRMMKRVMKDGQPN